ncbi:MAG: hypothetical protein P8P30_04415 [Rickettsiales bacterium]|nr:hypothetical protein [Rickettsiales bacterium]
MEWYHIALMVAGVLVFFWGLSSILNRSDRKFWENELEKNRDRIRRENAEWEERENKKDAEERKRRSEQGLREFQRMADLQSKADKQNLENMRKSYISGIGFAPSVILGSRSKDEEKD